MPNEKVFQKHSSLPLVGTKHVITRPARNA